LAIAIDNSVIPLQVGIVGTGYAARKRAEAIKLDQRAQLLVATGNNLQHTQDYCQKYGAAAVDTWDQLVHLPQLDLVFICTTNQNCGEIAKAAILAGKHVVVEYPLSLDAATAAEAIALAQVEEKLLHVEHIEIIGGLHQAVKQSLAQIGTVFYASYRTIAPQHPAVTSWKFHHAKFGFPLSAALSRVHRLTDLFGKVDRLSCRDRYWNAVDPDYFTACFCRAQLNFGNGITADITYGKGDVFWQSDRTLEICGTEGKITFEGQKGTLIQGNEKSEIAVTPRRGLFAQDTTMVLDYLCDRTPLYIQPQASLYALQVANAAQEAAATGKVVYLDEK